MTCHENQSNCLNKCFPEGTAYFIQHLHCCCNNSNEPTNSSNKIQMDWYVAKTGDDENGDGTVANPFLTIQKAINEIAKQPVLGNPYNLYIGDGEYLENVVASHLNLNFVGNVDNPQNVVIQANVVNSSAFHSVKSCLNVKGFTFKPSNNISTTHNFLGDAISKISFYRNR